MNFWREIENEIRFLVFLRIKDQSPPPAVAYIDNEINISNWAERRTHGIDGLNNFGYILNECSALVIKTFSHDYWY